MKHCISALLVFFVMCAVIFAVPLEAHAAEMTSSDALIAILKQREGFEKYPYKDNSQWSIGYGTRVPEGKLEYYQANGITESEAEELMREMLKGFESSLLSFVNKYKLTLKQHQFDALVSFSYNCGDAWTRETDGNMNRAVREGWTGSDFLYAICLWSKSGNQFSLINRRLYEANMYVNGIYESPYNHEKGTFRYVFLEAGQGETTYMIHGYDTRDPKPVRYEFKKTPAGYTFAGWYTAPENGKLVNVLDDSFVSGSVIYAMWKDSSGKLVYLPKGEACDVTVAVTKVNEYVSIRTGPGTQYAKIGELKKNASVKLVCVYDNNGDLWGQYEGGWISLKYTNYDEVISDSEVWPRTGTVTGDKVNVRNAPGTSNTTIMYKVNKGTKVTISEKTTVGSMEWGKLEDGNWISLDYVKFDPLPVEPEPEPEPEPKPEPEPEPEPIPPADPDPAADINGDGIPNEDDAIYLLQSVLMPNLFPIEQTCDYDGNKIVDVEDAIYLLQHILMPNVFPLK
jgi:GH24 family phage-related lysozyme (muramidase)